MTRYGEVYDRVYAEAYAEGWEMPTILYDGERIRQEAAHNRAARAADQAVHLDGCELAGQLYGPGYGPGYGQKPCLSCQEVA